MYLPSTDCCDVLSAIAARLYAVYPSQLHTCVSPSPTGTSCKELWCHGGDLQGTDGEEEVDVSQGTQCRTDIAATCGEPCW